MLFKDLYKLSLSEYWEKSSTYWLGACDLLGLEHHYGAFPATVDGLTYYLDAGGIRFFDGFEVAKPHHQQLAEETTGLKWFMPPQEMWPAVLVQLWFADLVRAAAKTPVTLRNLWRPTAYNKRVGGATKSDHIWACGMDLDFKSWGARRKASAALKPFWDSKVWWMSVGTGRKTIHLGLFGPRTFEVNAQRSWKYGNPDS